MVSLKKSSKWSSLLPGYLQRTRVSVSVRIHNVCLKVSHTPDFSSHVAKEGKLDDGIVRELNGKNLCIQWTASSPRPSERPETPNIEVGVQGSIKSSMWVLEI